VANAPAPSNVGSRYWTVPVGRALIALVPAAIITFNRDHSAEFGLLVFGSFALATGLLLVVTSARTLQAPIDRNLFLTQGIASLIAGGIALGFHAAGYGFFLFSVSVWAAVTGFLELYAGIRVPQRALPAKDWLFTGLGGAVLALLFLLLPPNPVVSVGIFGAYLVFLAVFLPIGGLSLKWAPPAQARASSQSPQAVSTGTAPNDSDSQ